MKGKTALVAGASGLVGNELLHVMLKAQEYEKIYAIVRTPLGVEHPKLIEVVCNFNKLNELEEYFGVDDVFCCLGTTIKTAKTKQAMYKVDVEYPLTIAKLAQKKHASHFLLISSMNANPKSPLWYPKMKGVLEEKLMAIPFDTISILRPSLLIGNRKEYRLGEHIAAKVFHGISFLLKDSWKSRLAVEAKTVALSMYYISKMDKKGVSIYSANSIADIARSRRDK
ncbi:NAD-dependent epimerase/dehydratase family protein [Peribacillus saganii]|uniref:NAD-dependent epimerase/dehydratase family protein n=1 Tax=Peribacillus saganii TaxID=2303992 RepID=A0A372LMN2_9BACI|nr:NAD-dependent epimerase/dehydratase family protein [Peribacillus saganii]RFU67916.1 NAD-dependent epimerase/dehydratase family protein [Peribacillus saganii]